MRLFQLAAGAGRLEVLLRPGPGLRFGGWPGLSHRRPLRRVAGAVRRGRAHRRMGCVCSNFPEAPKCLRWRSGCVTVAAHARFAARARVSLYRRQGTLYRRRGTLYRRHGTL